MVGAPGLPLCHAVCSLAMQISMVLRNGITQKVSGKDGECMDFHSRTIGAL